MNRNLDEVSFFLNPNSTTSILRKPIPILNLATDVTNLISNFTGETIGQLTGDEKMIKKNKPVSKFYKLFPISSALDSFWSIVDEEYNK
jgi:hypothetical protein